jgi:hypothetical protein
MRRKLADRLPARFEPSLAQSLHLLATRLRGVGDLAAARMALHEALAIRTRLAAEDASRHGAALAASQELLVEILAPAQSET